MLCATTPAAGLLLVTRTAGRTQPRQIQIQSRDHLTAACDSKAHKLSHPVQMSWQTNSSSVDELADSWSVSALLI